MTNKAENEASGVVSTALTNLALYRDPVVALNTWTHIAITKQGSTVRAFIGGVLAGTFTLPVAAVPGTAATPIIGADGTSITDNSRHFEGHIDDWRYTGGVCRYTATFTPPAAPFPDGGL